MNIAVCPGSFDPITLGHVDIVERAARLFDKVYVCTMVNAEKPRGMFSHEERLLLMKKALEHLPNVEVEGFSGLLAEYAARRGATALVKGLRNGRDFDDELLMYQVNRSLRDLETVLLPAKPEYLLCSSTVVRELLHYDQPLEGYVPPAIARDMKDLLHK